MPSVISPQELDQLTVLIGRFPDGVSLDALLRESGSPVSKRTLQRRQQQLARQGRG